MRGLSDPSRGSMQLHRDRLDASIRDTWRRWGELSRDYEATISRVGTLHLTCKNPACRAELETQHLATEHQEIICPPTEVTCPACGSKYKYEGSRLAFGAGELAMENVVLTELLFNRGVPSSRLRP